MSINVSEVIWTVLCFFALLFVLKKFLFDPLTRFMDEREARIEAGLAEGRQAQAKKEENEAAMQESWKQRNAEAKQLLSESKVQDDKRRAEVLSAAQADMAQSMQQARSRVQAEQEQTRAELDRKMPELAEELAKQLLGNSAE